MKIFLDTANVEEIRQGIEWGLVDGVTTNPSLMEKEKVNNFPSVVKSILAVTKGPVSIEVVATDYAGMIEQAHKIRAQEFARLIKSKFNIESHALRNLETIRLY